jgi:cytoskeletal protein RodZ
VTAAEGSRPGGGGAGSVDPDRQRILGVLIIVLAVLIGVILVFRGLSGQTATEVSSDPSVQTTTTVDRDAPPPTDATSSATTSSVYFTSGSEPAATEVAAALGLGATAVKPLPDPAPVASVGTAQVVVVLGADFATPTE